jgi:mono/diheme cytochrome c family protein
MKKINLFVSVFLLLLLLVACGPEAPASSDVVVESDGETAVSETQPTAEPVGMGAMGRGRGMMQFHHAPIPEEYAGLTSPIPADDASIARGGETYATHCATCHGDGGMGDGPGGATLDPLPAAIAHTSQMMGDDYLFWRVSEGGLGDPFNTGMIPWGNILTEEQRWDVLNYVRALGSGQVMPGRNAGGAMFDAEVMAAQQEAMLETAVSMNIVTAEEAAVFSSAHEAVDAIMVDKRGNGGSAGMDNMMGETLAELVAAGELTQADADTFLVVHDRLAAAGLMQ